MNVYSTAQECARQMSVCATGDTSWEKYPAKTRNLCHISAKRSITKSITTFECILRVHRPVSCVFPFWLGPSKFLWNLSCLLLKWTSHLSTGMGTYIQMNHRVHCHVSWFGRFDNEAKKNTYCFTVAEDSQHTVVLENHNIWSRPIPKLKGSIQFCKGFRKWWRLRPSSSPPSTPPRGTGRFYSPPMPGRKRPFLQRKYRPRPPSSGQGQRQKQVKSFLDLVG